MPKGSELMTISMDEPITSVSPELQIHQYKEASEIEYTEKHKCMGTIVGSNGERSLARFEYFESDLDTAEFQMSSEEEAYLHEELGLKNLHFKIYGRNAEQGKVGDISNRKVYVLMHGLAGEGNIFSDIKKDNGLSKVEEILALDPDAIVICGDYLGFGQTELMGVDDKDFVSQHVSISAYADEVDFLLTNILGVEPQAHEVLPNGVSKTTKANENVVLAGHSTGGGTVVHMAAHMGYNGVACASAYYFKESKAQNYPLYFGEYQPIYNAKRDAIHWKYWALSLALDVGSNVADLPTDLTTRISKASVGKVISKIGPDLIGKEVTNDESNTGAHTALMKLYGREFDTSKIPVDSALFTSLDNGMSIDALTPEQIINLSKVDHVMASDDNLVPRELIIATHMAIAARAEKLMWEHRAKNSFIPRESDQLYRTAYQMAKESVERLLKPETTQNGGHHAALFGDEDNEISRLIVFGRKP